MLLSSFPQSIVSEVGKVRRHDSSTSCLFLASPGPATVWPCCYPWWGCWRLASHKALTLPAMCWLTTWKERRVTPPPQAERTAWSYGVVPPRIDAVMGYLTSIQRSLFHKWLPIGYWWSATLGSLCKCPNTTLGLRKPITSHYGDWWVHRLPNSCRRSVGESKGGHFRRYSSITVFKGG